jgi:hypothetical protein
MLCHCFCAEGNSVFTAVSVQNLRKYNICEQQHMESNNKVICVGFIIKDLVKILN